LDRKSHERNRLGGDGERDEALVVASGWFGVEADWRIRSPLAVSGRDSRQSKSRHDGNQACLEHFHRKPEAKLNLVVARLKEYSAHDEIAAQ
jgi:hypothetical protein